MNIADPQFQTRIAGAATRIELWEQILQIADVRTMAEIGVWKGEYAQQILSRCPFIEHYYLIDPWANLSDWDKPFNVSSEAFNQVYRQAMDATAFASDKRIVLRGKTKQVIDQIPDNSLDFAYLDGDHTLRGITIDLFTILGKIKEGGLIGGDDFNTNTWRHAQGHEPTLVCPMAIYFAEAMNLPILGLPFAQFLIQKTSGASFRFIDTIGAYADISLTPIPFDCFARELKHRFNRAIQKLRRR